MASRPPLQVEDQTDEDFFDKLVDDDFAGTESGPGLPEGDDSDEAKAFANLSIGEVGTDLDDSSSGESKAREIHGGAALVDSHAEGSDSLVKSNSFGLDGVTESNNDSTEFGGRSDSTVNDGIGSAASGIKEVQWSSFNADPAQNGNDGFGSYSDFFSDLGENSREFPGKVEENLSGETKVVSGNEELKSDGFANSFNCEQYQEVQGYAPSADQNADIQDLNSSQYWENLYPGWKFDPNTGQWYQVDGYDATANVQGGLSFDANSAGDWAGSDRKSEVSYLQQTTQSNVETVTEGITTGSVSSWNQVSQGSNEYPDHMVFDPQYPDWYFDTIAQEWRTLETYTSSILSMAQPQVQHNQNGFASAGTYSQNQDHGTYSEYGQANSSYQLQGPSNRGQDGNWTGAYSNYNQQSSSTWQPETVAESQAASNFSGNQQLDNLYSSTVSTNNHVDQPKSFSSMGTVPLHEKASRRHDDINGTVGLQSFIPGGNFNQQYNKPKMEQNEQIHFSNDYYASQNTVNFSQQPLQSNHDFSCASSARRSSAGRPPHALVTFGFGGKLIVLKDNSLLGSSSYGSQDPMGRSISVLNLMEIVTEKIDAPGVRLGACNYFHALCQQSFPGPLVGASVGNKEVNKWIDERIANCDSPGMDYRKGEVLRLLLSLLKIACQHYGKLRSPFGTDTASRESDIPESAVAKLFASAKRHGEKFNAYGAITHCLQNLPSEGQIRATAAEVQSLLISGRTKEALHCAQEGQLWGPALVLAAQLGDQFYVDSVKQMALRQLLAGSPLRTLCLLIAGQPADVFLTDTTANNGFPGEVNMPQQSGQLGANVMLDDWEENLAVITANRTKDDELVIIHLGDCLWKERSEITAAHICYLVAEANFELYSDSARLCLIGADHWKSPRTFASPEAIQRTELYEYSKVLGNSQFILLPFQPYKLIYAHMLAEVGKVSEALKYCQAVLKSLKTGRAPEVDTWKQLVSSLEERIKSHQQGGFTTNLAPAKLVGKLLNLFDSTAHRVVGGLPPPVPSASQSSVQDNENYHQLTGPRVSTSQSTMAMSSLMPSASMEPISEWTADGHRKAMHNRSVSEPDFGRTPRQIDASKEEAASNVHGKASGSGGSSRFVRFGFGSQFLQKTVGLVLKRSDRQAKLGEKNKFYYDENLKRWVEEGAEPPAEETAPPPPPMTTAFQNGMSDYNLKNALKNEGSPTNRSRESKTSTSPEFNSGIPPIPPSSNQFSSRGRMGVRSRYVDTFNKGSGSGASANLFQSPSIPSVKSAGGVNPKFFIPAPTSSGEQTLDTVAENLQESAAADENPSTSGMNDSFQSPTSSMSMQRFSSMNNIPNQGVLANGNGSISSHSRRTASWSGSFNDAFSPPKTAETKPLGEALGMPPSTFMPSDQPLMQLQMNGGSLGDDLHEVEL
ncbi:protein transport protein SEC16B homolog [Malania oleifera]|uniref:protein transport protein SEC16B homolog n=1 Tax=Malania oleifera TaxID=397392 RepID=UPI0025ADCFD5|nr:protein transport protein SEC16B homolog [Malania oleifera]